MLFQDLRYGIRSMRKTPIFTVAAILTLALGIGANTAIFSVVNAILLRPLPFTEPDRLVRVFEKNDRIKLSQFSSSLLNYLSWKEQTQSLEPLGCIGFVSFNLTGAGDPEQFSGSTLSPSMLPLLGIQPVLGRGFRDDEDKPQSPPVAMISEGLWRRRFGADATMIGKTITLNGLAYTLIGVAPPALTVLTTGEIWTPLIIDPGRENRLNHVTVTVGRLNRGITLAQAQAEMDTVSRRVGQQYPEVKDWGVELMTFPRWFVQDQLRTALLVLLCAVVFVLLIACANVANLLLSRAVGRQKEIAVRAALGAGRGRLVCQLLTESVALSLCGGVTGVLIAVWAVRAMSPSLPTNLPLVRDIGVDSTVLLFALGITVVTGVLFGLAPAWQITKADLNEVLKLGGRSGSGGTRPILRKALIGGELSLATVLLIGAGLLTQSLLRLQQVRLGFRPDHLLTFQLSTPASKYPGVRAYAFYKTLLESLETLPGVRGATISSGMPLGAGSYNTSPTLPIGKSLLPPGEALPIDWRTVSPSYFRTMEIPLVSGRTFNDQDGTAPPVVAVVSQETAKKVWGTEDPIGKMLHAGTRDMTVIGVVGGVRNNGLGLDPSPTLYYPSALRVLPVMDVVVRTEGEPTATLSAVRQRIRDLDSEMPMSNVRTMDQWISNGAAQPRLNTILLETFALIALLIAAIGIYGVLSYSVTQRTREIGVRIAIGAQRRDVLRLVVGEGMTVALAGIGVGVLGALAVSRLMASILFGIQARDAATFAVVTGALVTIAAAACYIPARRATRVDPVVALRDQ
jgi:putative ABC transport system permease protein